jgi:hypothetical protein
MPVRWAEAPGISDPVPWLACDESRRGIGMTPPADTGLLLS